MVYIKKRVSRIKSKRSRSGYKRSTKKHRSKSLKIRRMKRTRAKRYRLKGGAHDYPYSKNHWWNDQSGYYTNITNSSPILETVKDETKIYSQIQDYLLTIEIFKKTTDNLVQRDWDAWVAKAKEGGEEWEGIEMDADRALYHAKLNMGNIIKYHNILPYIFDSRWDLKSTDWVAHLDNKDMCKLNKVHFKMYNKWKPNDNEDTTDDKPLIFYKDYIVQLLQFELCIYLYNNPEFRTILLKSLNHDPHQEDNSIYIYRKKLITQILKSINLGEIKVFCKIIIPKKFWRMSNPCSIFEQSKNLFDYLDSLPKSELPDNN